MAALGCDGCHGGGEPPVVTLTASPAGAGFGEPITLTITLSNANGASAGFYLTTSFESIGTFEAVDGGTVRDSSGVMHTTPRAASAAGTTFTARWTAHEATGVAFDVYALSANGDRSTRGDGAGHAHLELAVGCSGQSYYIDQDGDGYGSADPLYPARLGCAPPLGYAARAGDCDDFRREVYPAAPELCDLRDNDCNGQVDDEVVSQPFCADRDGDGHGVGEPIKMDCKPTPGFGACDRDCDDGDASFHPGARETCDLRDNDCDGEVDEGVHAGCGVGLCARRALRCDASDCTPGDPMPETCNGFDDDCDGVVDNGEARCRAEGGVSGAGGGDMTGSSGGAVVSAGAAPTAASTTGACGLGPARSADALWGPMLAAALLWRRRFYGTSRTADRACSTRRPAARRS